MVLSDAQKPKKKIDTLTPEERRELDAALARARELDAFPHADYVTYHGLDWRGQGDETTEGCNQVYCTDFVRDVENLQRQFPGEVVRVLDVGCGRGVFLSELGAAFERPDRQKIETIGTNLPEVRGEDLPYPDESFHLVISTSAATLYTSRLDLVLDEMHRVLKKGGVMLFHRTPTMMAEEKLKAVFDEFTANHRVKIEEIKGWGGSYKVIKPK